MAGASKGACVLAPPTPVKFGRERSAINSASDGRSGGDGNGELRPGVEARKVNFMVPENQSSSNNVFSGINRLPNFIIIEQSDKKRPHQESSNVGCEFGSDRTKSKSSKATPKKGNERKKRVKVKRHTPRVLDKSKKKKPSTPKPSKPSTPKPRTPKRPKLAEKNTVSNKTPVEPLKVARVEEVVDSTENTCRRKLDFDIENQTSTNQTQKTSVEIESKPEVRAKLQELPSDRLGSLIVYRSLNECLKNSRRLGPNCPGKFKKARTRRPRATKFEKYLRIGSLPRTTQTKNNSAVNELMSLGPIVRDRLTRSQTRGAVTHLDFKKWATNLHWEMQRKRSKALARICYSPSFVHDISKLHFSGAFISKASAIRKKDVSHEITVAHVKAQDEGVLNSDKNASIEQQELHPDNVDSSHESNQVCTEDFDDPMVGVETSLDTHDYQCENVVVVVEEEDEHDDDVLDNQHYDWFAKALVDYASQMMACLRMDDMSEKNMEIISYKGKKNPSGKKKSEYKPKMDLDLDVVMSSGEKEDTEAEYWIKERALFKGRVDEFINTLDFLHGRKVFSAWKGSVVDSVVGVFLTQNVCDNLSSTAFMNIVARFPAVSDPSEGDCDGESDSARLRITEGHSDEHERLFTIDSDSGHNSQTEVNHNDNEAEYISSQGESTPGINRGNKVKKGKLKNQQKINWDELRLKYSSESKFRTEFTRDSVNWEAVRQASVHELADLIKDRGMHRILARSIKEFLDRIVADHGAIDLEWLRNVPSDKVKEYLLSFKGLGLKSVECVRLLALRLSAFPVDVNISRIATRLHWITLHTLPESLLIHQLKEYPNLDSVQRYLAPRLAHISHAKLYEFHCHLILFGKTICIKEKPNCGLCPFQSRCRHFASMSASNRPRLDGYPVGNMPTAYSQETQALMRFLEGSFEQNMSSASSQDSQGLVVESQTVLVNSDREFSADCNCSQNCEPIIEIPESPVRNCSESDLDVYRGPDDIEDLFNDEGDEMLILNLSQLDKDIKTTSELSLRFGPKSELRQKEVERLRTVHQVYELPDSHPLLAGFSKRYHGDPNPYLLALWKPEEISTSSPNLEKSNMSEERTNLGDIVKYRDEGMIKGTILIPCQTVNNGSFPLNGTYFQNNQVFADHETTIQPINVPREWISYLEPRLLYCSTSIRSISKGMSGFREMGWFFHYGFMCIKGFDRKTMSPKPLQSIFHDTRPKSKPRPKNKNETK